MPIDQEGRNGPSVEDGDQQELELEFVPRLTGMDGPRMRRASWLRPRKRRRGLPLLIAGGVLAAGALLVASRDRDSSPASPVEPIAALSPVAAPPRIAVSEVVPAEPDPFKEPVRPVVVPPIAGSPVKSRPSGGSGGSGGPSDSEPLYGPPLPPAVSSAPPSASGTPPIRPAVTDVVSPPKRAAASPSAPAAKPRPKARPKPAPIVAPVSVPKAVARAPVAPVSPAAIAAPGGGFQVQLLSVRSSAADAEKQWHQLLRRHEDVLGALSPVVVRADLGSRGVYFRLRAGPLASRREAEEVCAALGARQQGCFIVAD